MNIEHLRHTLAHLLAAAVHELYPNAKPTLGPPVEHGFYYDFEFSEPISDKDLPAIEEQMRKILPSWTGFTAKKVSPEEAKKQYSNNPYKQELVDEIVERGEDVTLYTAGSFTDLCRGGHLENPAQEIDPKAFTLTHAAGAYWRGDEDNTMLTRIYGSAFATKKELAEHLKMREEAKKRDHRKLGKELDLFAFSEQVGAGLPLFTPKGVVIRNEIERYLEELQLPRGYEKVWIPHLAKKDLYETSGHWEKFSDDIFHVYSGGEFSFVLKPMNCPHHTQIYASQPRSYRDLPVRYFEVTEMYRDEKPGQLQGLTRVRSITIDDAHVFCRPDQIEEEVNTIYDMIEKFYKTFGMNLTPRLSIRDPQNPEKYIGDKKQWEKAEDTLRSITKSRVKTFEEREGEAAFYGPKIDFEAEDVLGRTWQLATIQLDFAMPERFGLEYTDQEGEKKQVVMIHRAISGSLERFMAILIEHFAGAFPTWLAPVQAIILPVAEKHQAYALETKDALEKAGVRTALIDSDETLGKRIRTAEMQKIPYSIVVGDKEEEDESVNVRSRKDDSQNTLSRNSFIETIQKEISSRSL